MNQINKRLEKIKLTGLKPNGFGKKVNKLLRNYQGRSRAINEEEFLIEVRNRHERNTYVLHIKDTYVNAPVIRVCYPQGEDTLYNVGDVIDFSGGGWYLPVESGYSLLTQYYKKEMFNPNWDLKLISCFKDDYYLQIKNEEAVPKLSKGEWVLLIIGFCLIIFILYSDLIQK